MKPITVLEMTPEQREFAERVAQALGFTQTAYTSHSLPGLYCLPDRQTQKKGTLIQTQEYGLVMFADLEDLNLHELAQEQFNIWREKTKSPLITNENNSRPLE